MEDNQVAANVRARLAEEIGQERFELWFDQQTQFRIGDGCLTIVTSSSFKRDWLRRNFADGVRAVCATVMGGEVRVAFEIDESLVVANAEPVAEASTKSTPVVTVPTLQRRARSGDAPASPILTNGAASPVSRQTAVRTEPSLAELVVGASNEYAVRAAEVTAHGLQQASPVTFCGVTGVGKTHMLRAIRAEYRRTHPRARAVYLTAEQFITTFVEALRSTGLPSFRQKCRGADLLLDRRSAILRRQAGIARRTAAHVRRAAGGRSAVGPRQRSVTWANCRGSAKS